MSMVFGEFFKNNLDTQDVSNVSNTYQDRSISQNQSLIKETDCADVASVDTCLNVLRFEPDLDFYGLNHLIKRD